MRVAFLSLTWTCRLSPWPGREMDVFMLVAKGHSNADIAARLFISPKTVETHVASLIAKTGQSSRRELVAHAARIAPL
jgi:DNA-binding CsgD family transcriptional regulator